MLTITIDNKQVQVSEGSTILEAARQLGIDIPTLCYSKGYEPSTSCMVCVVEVEGLDYLVPSCGYPAKEGMSVRTDTEHVLKARKKALELLLSDHVGDCMGPCQMICPAKMNIPLMIRQIQSGHFNEAIQTVKREIALPAVLGRICPAPCENGCRRSYYDQPVSICLLKRFVADKDLFSDAPFVPDYQMDIGKKVAIIGAGPAGLSAAYYLSQQGVACVVMDANKMSGGMLRYAVDDKDLSKSVLDKEISTLTQQNIVFKYETIIGQDVSLQQLCGEYDAVFVATGQGVHSERVLEEFNLGKNGIIIDSKTYMTSVKGVFAGGDVVRKRRLTVRSVADGKEAAAAILQYLTGTKITGSGRRFNCRMGKLQDDELKQFAEFAESRPRLEGVSNGLNPDQAVTEAGRCFHCDCRKANDCKLKSLSEHYEASSACYKSQRRKYEQNNSHPDIVYEPGKCIDCGLCIQIAKKHNQQLGLCFIGRGFNVRVAVPFNQSLQEALDKAAQECVRICPTGAIALKDK